jgi:TatA/E family protein of Tat protein translocase
MDIFGLGPAEILLILFVLLLFFGKDKLPELARSIGHSFKELRGGFSEGMKSPTESSTAASTTPAATTTTTEATKTKKP